MNNEEKKVYEKTIEMFNGKCVVCGSPNIHMHHISHGGLNGGRKTYMGNVIPLCEKHHRMAHSCTRTWTPMLQDIVNEKIRAYEVIKEWNQ